MSRRITSTQIAFVDTTDSRKLECNIASNWPTVQIYDQNLGTYSPNWSTNNLILSPSVYLDATNVTTPISPATTTYIWYCKNGTDAEVQVSTNQNLTINTNITHASGMVTYRCVATYKVNATDTVGISATSSITFSRTDSGINGTNGSSAPAVQAQYSTISTGGWTNTLNVATHKYIRLSYDNGDTWTSAIKISGEDGTSLTIEGSYDTYAELTTAHPVGQAGDSYLVDGDLYIWDTDTTTWKNVGNIQGPQGQQGASAYTYIRYATSSSGANMSTSPSDKTYIGIAVTTTNTAPSSTSAYTWSKFVGDNAKSIALTADSQVFKVSNTNTVTPSTIAVTAQTSNTTVTTWTYSVDGGQTFLSTAPTGVSRNGNTVSINGTSLASNSLTIKASDGTYSDALTIYKALDGSNGSNGNDGVPASIAFLTNENITFVADTEGKISGTAFTTNVVGYEGSTKVTPVIGDITELPTGMNYGGSTTMGNELILLFTIDNNATLGSTSNINGGFVIPVTSPVITNLKLNWSKVNMGDKGDPGVSPINVEITSSVGNLYINNNIAATLTAKVYQANIDITSEFPDSAFLWEKYDIDGVKDSVWSYLGKSVQISNVDVWKRAMFNCEVDIEQRL